MLFRFQCFVYTAHVCNLKRCMYVRVHAPQCNATQEFGQRNSTTQNVQPPGNSNRPAHRGATSFSAAAVECKELCNDDADCTAAEVRQNNKKKKTVFEMRASLRKNQFVDTAIQVKSCKKATFSVKPTTDKSFRAVNGKSFRLFLGNDFFSIS